MARKFPVPSSEVSIINRVFDALSMKKWSIATLARESGVENHTLLNLKHHRACLLYKHARLIIHALGLNVHWVATSVGEPFLTGQSFPLPSNESLDYPQHVSFSLVYAARKKQLDARVQLSNEPGIHVMPGKVIFSKPVALDAAELAKLLATILSL